MTWNYGLHRNHSVSYIGFQRDHYQSNDSDLAKSTDTTAVHEHSSVVRVEVYLLVSG